MFDFNVGKEHGVTLKELSRLQKLIAAADKHFKTAAASALNRRNLGMEWLRLPQQSEKDLRHIQNLGKEIREKFSDVLFLGIGGSYLGLKAAQDALAFANPKPRVFFAGNNLDPDTLSATLKALKAKETFVVVISKSGETIETKVAFALVLRWLKKSLGNKYGRQIIAITDPQLGALRRLVNAEHLRDKLSFRSLPLLPGVGGRYSEFNMGLLHLAVLGIDIKTVLAGAKAMQRACSASSVCKNPAYMYAALHTILYCAKGKDISIIMPFCEGLKSTADWYIQLLAESTGKKYERKILTGSGGLEQWYPDLRKPVNAGRTPVACCGTGDLHSVQQNNVHGENNKAVTFIRVEKFHSDLKVPSDNRDFIAGKSFTDLMKLAQQATAWALVRENRPNCTIVLPELNPFTWGGLLYFFEMATAFEAELLNVNAFDQPGVEGYKNYMYYKLRKPGIAKSIAEEIEKHPLVKKSRFIL